MRRLADAGAQLALDVLLDHAGALQAPVGARFRQRSELRRDPFEHHHGPALRAEFLAVALLSGGLLDRHEAGPSRGRGPRSAGSRARLALAALRPRAAHVMLLGPIGIAHRRRERAPDGAG